MAARYKHIIWDWNGTLLNDIALCIQVLNRLLARRERTPITQEDYRQNFGFPVIHFYKYLGLETDESSFEQVSREFIEDYERHWFKECALHPEAASVLTQLTQLGISHSVLSAAKQEALDAGIQHFGIHPHFLGLAGADNIYAEGKIAKGHNWVQQLDWDPGEIVLIGDTVHDYEVAQAIGTDCILMAHGHHSFERLSETKAQVVHSLQELVPLIQAI
jgi:phosphoglycolate phosphatase